MDHTLIDKHFVDQLCFPRSSGGSSGTTRSTLSAATRATTRAPPTRSAGTTSISKQTHKRTNT